MLRVLIFFPVFLSTFAPLWAQSQSCRDLFRAKTLRTLSGTLFEYSELLSNQGQSIVVRYSTDTVLRIPKLEEHESFLVEQRVKQFVEGYELLINSGVSDIADVKKVGPDWVMQKYISFRLSLEDFLNKSEEIQSNNPREFLTMVRGLKKWGRQTALFSEIGDFYSGQLIWDGKKWILLDWSHQHRMASPDSHKTVFSRLDSPSALAHNALMSAHAETLKTRRELFKTLK